MSALEQGGGHLPDPLGEATADCSEDPVALIDVFIDAFYVRVLQDPLLAPVFVDVAQIHVAEHLPRIKAYWRKMLLREPGYDRHMMRKHRDVDALQHFTADHYERWLSLFEQTLAETSLGSHTEPARQLARRIAGNMRQNIEQFRSNI